MATPQVVTVSLNPAIDRVIEVPEFAVGGHAQGRLVLRQPAGKAVNVSRALAKLGRASVATGWVGRGELAEFEAFLRECGGGLITPAFVPVAGRTRENITVVDPVRRTDTHIRDVGLAVTEEDQVALVRRLLEFLDEPGGEGHPIVVFAGGLPAGLPPLELAGLINHPGRAGAPLVLDVAGAALARAAAVLGDGLFLAKPNAEELAEATGSGALRGRQEVLAAARRLTRHVRWVAASLGADGALLVGREQVVAGTLAQDPALVVDTVGCGDCFFAGMLDGYLADGAPETMLRRALAAGTANTREAGAANFDPKLVAELERSVAIEPVE